MRDKREVSGWARGAGAALPGVVITSLNYPESCQFPTPLLYSAARNFNFELLFEAFFVAPPPLRHDCPFKFIHAFLRYIEV